MFRMKTFSRLGCLSHTLLVANSPLTHDTSCMMFTRKSVSSWDALGWGRNTSACVGVNRDRLLAVVSGDVTQVREPWLLGLLIFQMLLSHPEIALTESIKRPSGDARPSEEGNPQEDTARQGEHAPALPLIEKTFKFFKKTLQHKSEWSTTSALSLRQ